MSLNPVLTSQKVFDRFSSYILTSLKLKDDSLNRQIAHALREKARFSKGPIIESTPPYEAGRSIRDLMAEGMLSNAFDELQTPGLPIDRQLYRHQEETIIKICRDHRNAVVATGTGSGKTESFIIPILNHLLSQQKEERLTPGVRALLLYPMNALANDQMKRLRELLKNQPDITFGIYTGETEERYQAAVDKFIRMHQRPPLTNELISREQMKDKPPHILLTNYAMLEYLMLRPADNVFFQGPHAGEWKFVVIDEAHTYSGAKGIEMSMLIARLKSTIGIPPGRLTCIMTSASLGKGREDFGQVADFAGKLFQEPFDAGDVIEATKKQFRTNDTWGRPDSNIYRKVDHWLGEEEESEFSLKTILQAAGVPERILTDALVREEGNLKAVLYRILSGDERVDHTIRRLSKSPVALDELAAELFPDDERANIHTAALVDLCNQVRLHEQDHPLLPARYHFLVKALEGAFITLSNPSKIFLDRTNRATIEQVEYKAFEMGSCNKCNSLYLVGVVLPGQEKPYDYLVESKNRYIENESRLEYFALLEQNSVHAVEDEDAVLEGVQLKIPAFSDYRLCVFCGAIGAVYGEPVCDCEDRKTVRLLKVNQKDRKVHKCGICGAVNPTGNIVRRFYLSEDAVSSVLATALYQELPTKRWKNDADKENQAEDIFGFLQNGQAGSPTVVKSRKQLLVFSDSRQNAAYFAPYLSRTYQDLLVKNAMVKTLEKHREECINNRWTLTDYYHRIERHVKETGLMKESVETMKRDVWKWIMREFAVDMGPNSLESMGLIHFLPRFNEIEGIEIIWQMLFLEKAGFKQEEAPVLFAYLLDQFRSNRAVSFPEEVPPTDPFFEPQNQQGGFWRRKPEGVLPYLKGYSLKGWAPASLQYSNGRLDYLKKVMEAGRIAATPEEVTNLLDNLLTALTDSRSPMAEYMKNEQLSGLGKMFKLDPKIYMVTPGIDNDAIVHYQCDTCYKTTIINLRGVCPTYRCEGALQAVDLDDKLQDNHYRNLYRQIKPENMKASEHTAQLTTEYAAEVQSLFINGDVNVLSCSTTFELGVDVGELETVFMKNMPPTPANYAQRAGRAGRRTDSTAFALTYARLASHDFSSFKDPGKMISGVVKPPYFEVANKKIALRHLYACAFSHFWRLYPNYFKSVDDFFNSDPKGPDLFRQYLNSRPEDLYFMLQDVTPERLRESVHLEEWGWVEELYGESGVMTKVAAELEHDLKSLQQALQVAVENEQYGRANVLKRVRNTITRRPLINYFSQKNLIPKYGFPVDVVELEINSHTDEAKNIDLSRDLQIAISEYAPGGQVVANGKLWTSRYVKRVANRELIRYRYMQCKCGYFNKFMDLEQTNKGSCPACGNAKPWSGTFVMPEFGFISESSAGDPGDRKPEKTYSGRKHFSGSGEQLEAKIVSIGSNLISLNAQEHGVLTVINNGVGNGFYLCRFCGYGTTGKTPSSHRNPHDALCSGKFEKVALGYDFETDILVIDFMEIFKKKDIPEGYWESLMYSIIEGMSASLEIDRSDIDGTLHINNDMNRSIILFDTVPGGAGHVKRMLQKENLIDAFKEALRIVSNCTCGADKMDTSCYSCLRNYYNQYCHDDLRRDYPIEALELILHDVD